jgi:hypothetical protein
MIHQTYFTPILLMLALGATSLSCNFINATIQRKQQSIKVQLCHTMFNEECLQSNNTLNL